MNRLSTITTHTLSAAALVNCHSSGPFRIEILSHCARTRSHSIQPCPVSPKRGACFAATSRLPVRLICPKEILRRIPPRTLCFSRRRGAVASLEPWQRRLRARPSSAFLQDSDKTHVCHAISPSLTEPIFSGNLEARGGWDHAT